MHQPGAFYSGPPHQRNPPQETRLLRPVSRFSVWAVLFVYLIWYYFPVFPGQWNNWNGIQLCFVSVYGCLSEGSAFILICHQLAQDSLGLLRKLLWCTSNEGLRHARGTGFWLPASPVASGRSTEISCPEALSVGPLSVRSSRVQDAVCLPTSTRDSGSQRRGIGTVVDKGAFFLNIFHTIYFNSDPQLLLDSPYLSTYATSYSFFLFLSKKQTKYPKWK